MVGLMGAAVVFVEMIFLVLDFSLVAFSVAVTVSEIDLRASCAAIAVVPTADGACLDDSSSLDKAMLRFFF